MMKRSDFSEVGAYIAAAVVSVGVAFLIAIKFLTPSHAQVPPNPANHSAPGNSALNANSNAASAPPTSGLPEGIESEEQTLKDLAGFLEPFLYDSSNRRDPFMPFSDYIPSNNTGQRLGLTPAQQYDLDKLKLVGIMWDVRDPKAMFSIPNSQDVIVLGRDEGIGVHNGYIASIREGEVVVVESFRRRGDVVYRTRVLRLQR